MKTKTIKTYEFDELDAKSKGKARDWYREYGFDDRWFESTYKDASNIGFKITGFDIYRLAEVTGEFTDSASITATRIIEEHGEACDTYTTARAYLKARSMLVAVSGVDESEELDEVDEEFRKSLCGDYLKILRSQMEYLQSNENVDEGIRGNEYVFTQSGSRSVSL